MSEPIVEPVTADPGPGESTSPPDATRGSGGSGTHARKWLCFSWSGLLGALVFFCLSLTPSLLPRSPLLQGVVGGILAAIGYGIGVSVRFGVRYLFGGEPSPRVMRTAWWTLAGAGAASIVMFLWLGSRWQAALHRLMDEPAPGAASPASVVVVAAAFGFVLLLMARGVRSYYRWVTKTANRFVPRRASIAIGLSVTVLLLVLLFQGILFDTFVTVSNRMFSVRNDDTPAGIERNPSSSLSGGDGSLVSWKSLGREGRKFVSNGPTPEELSRFSGREALEPIRVYAGVESAPSVDARARLAVQELDRTNAWDRDVLLVVATTGSGWVNPASTYPVEYMYNGDSATVSMQYSYLPSWISFLVDQSKASDAGRTLFNSVYQRWAELPETTRPKLLVYGESLGSFGTEAAFSGEADMTLRTDGMLLVGPPAVNPLHRDFTKNRDEGSPEWLPIYQGGRSVRFVAEPANFDRPDAPWPGNRVVYLQHGSDPIVFWTPDLLLGKPDWLREQRAPDRSPAMHWYPFVTFFQVTVDMFFANGVPPGHGHRYGTLTVDAWQWIAPPVGWTDADSNRLKATLVERGWAPQ